MTKVVQAERKCKFRLAIFRGAAYLQAAKQIKGTIKRVKNKYSPSLLLIYVSSNIAYSPANLYLCATYYYTPFFIMNTPITLSDAQQQVDEWIRTYGVRYFNELTNMAILTEEVGELARVMARTYGEQSFKEGEKPNLADEMADVLWVLVCLANQTGVDLTEAWHQTIEKKTRRDKERHKNNEKLR